MIWRILIIMMLVFAAIGAVFHQAGNTPEEFKNATNRMSYAVVTQNLSLEDMAADTNLTFPARVVYKYADFMMFTTLEGGKYVMEYGYEHPEHDYLFWAKVLLWLWILSAAIPIIYLIVFIWYCCVQVYAWLGRFTKRKNK